MNLAIATEAALILLREGAEALLIIAAVAAYLIKTGAPERLKALYAGAAAAIVASLVTAWVFEQFYDGEHDDFMEGVTMLLAAAILLYTSGWLFLRQDPRVWQGYVRQHAERAVAMTGALPLATVSFLAVYREGAETVLFLHALAKSGGAGWVEIALGILAGTAMLVAAFLIARHASAKLPLRPLFIITSAVLFILALRFIGAGFEEFQEMGWIGFDDPGFPAWIIDSLVDIGFNPSAEALITQGMVIVAAVVSAPAVPERAISHIDRSTVRDRPGAPGRRATGPHRART
jgi:high-affinity iron transporter